MQADGVSSSRAKRYFTPRRSPNPSSPTVAAKITGRCVRTRAPSIVSASASIAASPRELSHDPRSGQLRALARHADGGAFGEHRVEVCADQHGRLTRGAGSRRDHVADGIDAYVVQTERLEPLRHLGAARVLRAGGRGDLGQRDLRVDDPVVVGGEPGAGGREACEEVGRRGGTDHVAGTHALSMAGPDPGARCRGADRSPRGCGMRYARRVRGDAHQRPRQAFFIPSMTATDRPRLGRNVLALAAVSFLTDVSSEMIYPLLPVFLTTVLGANASFIGAIEGAAETTAALLKLASGWWSDRMRKRKPLVFSGLRDRVDRCGRWSRSRSRASQVLFIRVADRVGKGIRNAPRDALIAESVDPSIRGRAFGFHRAADHAGGVVGPLIAFALLSGSIVELRTVFWLAAIPGVLSVLVVAFGGARRAARCTVAGRVTARSEPAARTRGSGAFLARDLPLHARQLDRRVSAAAREPARRAGGARADPLGGAARREVGGEHSWRSAVGPHRAPADADRGLGAVRRGVLRLRAAPSVAWQAWALFAVYGVFFGLTEGSERALVADLVALRAARDGVRLVQPGDRARRAAGVTVVRLRVGPRRSGDGIPDGRFDRARGGDRARHATGRQQQRLPGRS